VLSRPDNGKYPQLKNPLQKELEATTGYGRTIADSKIYYRNNWKPYRLWKNHCGQISTIYTCR